MAKRKPISTAEEKETCILVGLATQNQKREQLQEYLDELAFLVSTANAISKKTFIQSLSKPDVRTFVGSGKLMEIRDYVKAEGIDMIVFDDELSGSQIRNIEKEIEGVKILDRPNLILDIFAQRATDFPRENTSRTSTIPIPTTAPYKYVDSPSKAERRYRNERTWGERNRD